MKILGRVINIIASIFPRLFGKLGFFLFCYVPQKKMKSYHREFLEDALRYKFDFDGNEYAYYKWGNGAKVVLLVHGWRSHSARWRRLIEKFDLKEYSFIAVDAPGHGLSNGKQFTLIKYGKLLNHLMMGHKKIDAVIGHSIGGMAVLYTLFNYEKLKVNKLVIMASPGSVEDFIKEGQRQIGFNDKVFKLLDKEMLKRFGLKFEYFNVLRFAREIDVPGLIIHDLYDPDCPVENSQKMHEIWKKSKLHLTKGKGHNLRDDDVLELIKDYMISGRIGKDIKKAEPPKATPQDLIGKNLYSV